MCSFSAYSYWRFTIPANHNPLQNQMRELLQVKKGFLTNEMLLLCRNLIQPKIRAQKSKRLWLHFNEGRRYAFLPYTCASFLGIEAATFVSSPPSPLSLIPYSVLSRMEAWELKERSSLKLPKLPTRSADDDDKL